MKRRTALATMGISLSTPLVGCLEESNNTETENENQEDEQTLERPTDDPIATERIGETTTDNDPHIVFIQTTNESRTFEVQLHSDESEDVAHLEQYTLEDGEHIRIELLEPDRYTVELFEADSLIGIEPYEIEADWFEYDCPSTVIELRGDDRIAASTEPDTTACS